MKKITMLMTLICISIFALAQNADEESIKKITQAEANAIAARDLNALSLLWKHDANAFTTFTSRFGYNTAKSWDTISARLMRDWSANPAPIFSKIETSNHTIRLNGYMALVDYDAELTPVSLQPEMFPYIGVRRYHNYETLVKEGDQWKIISRINTDPGSYTLKEEHAVETELNRAGYGLIAANKLNEAIEVFKLNVKLFPHSYNTYDSLGEAYALAGNKKLAIENYERSMKLNPNSVSGPPALAKLRQK